MRKVTFTLTLLGVMIILRLPSASAQDTTRTTTVPQQAGTTPDTAQQQSPAAIPSEGTVVSPTEVRPSAPATVQPATDTSGQAATAVSADTAAPAGSAIPTEGTVISPTEVRPAAAAPSEQPATTADTAAQVLTTVADSATQQPADTSALVDTTGKVEVGTQTASNTNQLNGLVLEKDGKTPIIGATVQWQKDQMSTQTDIDGKFSIENRPNGGVLTVNSVGFTAQNITVQPGQNDLKITLGASSDTKIDEVVVTALGQERDTRAVGYGMQMIEGRSVQEAKEVNYMNALQGKLAGVQINGNSGSMGGSSKVVMRGLKSISNNNNALFIVDGVPMANINMNTINGNQATGGGGYDYGNPAQLINPNDIENISVLRGASATALYGSRGQNGVIYITTKSGKGAGKVSVTYDLSLQMDRVSYLPKFQNEYGAGSGGTGFTKLYANEHPEAFGPNGGTYDDGDGLGSYDLLPEYTTDMSWGPRLDGQMVRHWWSWDPEKNNPDFGKSAPWQANPNNVRDFFENGFTLSNNLSVSSSSEKGSIRFSMGQTKQSFIYPGSKLDRVYASINTTYNFTDKFTFSGGFNYIMDKSTGRASTGFAGNNPMQQLVMFGQRQLDNEHLKDYEYDDGTQRNWNRTAWDNGAPRYAENPYWNQLRNYNSDRNDRFFGNVGLNYKVTPWLSLDARVFSDFFDHIDEVRQAKAFLVGGYQKRNILAIENNYQFMANMGGSFANDNMTIKAIVGGNIRNNKYNQDYGTTNGGLMSPDVYVLQNSVLPATVSQGYDNRQINSLFAQATLGYRNLLFLDVTGRGDWASTLWQTGNGTFVYPSVSGSFVFSDLIKPNKWLNLGKLRMSYAEVGNDIPAYQVYQYFTINTPFDGNPVLTVPDNRYNENLKPERTREFEVGTDLSMLNNRLGINFTFYNRNTINQFWPIEVPASTGYLVRGVNGGNVQNRGIELTVTGTPLQVGDFKWESALNIARNRNKVLNLNSEDGNVSKVVIGTERRTQKVSIVAMPGYPLGTLVGTDYVYDENGNKVVTADGYYAATDSTVIIGDANPDFYGGFSNTFSYKGFYLSALIDFSFGGDFFSYTNLYGNISGNLAESAANGIRENGIVVDGVKADGTPNDINISAQDHFNNNFATRISSANMYDATYIYLREVRLGCYLPEKWVNKIGFQGARFSLVGRNLWLMHSNAPNVDPSNITNSIGTAQGFEGGALPPVRSYGFNLNLNF